MDDKRGVSLGQGRLGRVWLQQARLADALPAHAEVRARFESLGELGSMPVLQHRTGTAHHQAGPVEAAENAGRQALAVRVRLGDRTGQASTRGQLGNLQLIESSDGASGWSG